MPGRYVFRLTVTDDQGLTDEDTVSVIVKHGKEDKIMLAKVLILFIDTELLFRSAKIGTTIENSSY